MPMGRGSDTRLYNPKSESSHLYSGGDDRERDEYRYGDGDTEHMDQLKGKEQEQQEQVKVSDAPHLQIEHEKPPEPQMPSMMEEEEAPQMEEDENAVGAEVSQMTAPSGYVDSGLNASAGAMAGPGAALGGYRPMLATGESLDWAWSSLMKAGAFQPSQYPQEMFQLTPSSDIPVASPEDRMSRHVGMGVIPEDDTMLSQISARPVPRIGVQQMPHPNPYSGMIEEVEAQMPDTSFHYKLRPDEVHRWKGHHFPKDTPFEERANMMEELRHRQGQIKELQSRSKLAGEPIDDAWSSLMKAKMSPAEKKVWTQPQFKYRSPGGRRPWIGSTIRGKARSRRVSPRTEHGGLTEQHYAVEPSHLGVSTKQPMKLFPEKYRQYLAQAMRRKLQGGMSMPYTSHAPYGQRSTMGVGKIVGQLPGQAASAKIPGVSRPKGIPKVKDVLKAEIQEDVRLLKFNLDYMQYSQLRNLLRKVKGMMERKERAQKALPTSGGGPGERGETAHREGSDGTTKPQGATEVIDEDDNPQNWGAHPAEVARGSGRIG